MDKTLPLGRLFETFTSIGEQLSGVGSGSIRLVDAEPIALLIASVSLLTICILGLTVVWPHRDLFKPEARRAAIAPAATAAWPSSPPAPSAGSGQAPASAEFACHFNEWHLRQHAALSKAPNGAPTQG